MNLCRLLVHMANCWHYHRTTEIIHNTIHYNPVNLNTRMKLSEIEGFPTEVALSVENLDAAISVFEKSVSELVSTSLVDAHSNVNIKQYNLCYKFYMRLIFYSWNHLIELGMIRPQYILSHLYTGVSLSC